MTGNVIQYDPIFKENAVLLSYERETVIQTAKELDITPKILSKWRGIYRPFKKGCFPGRGHTRVYHENKKIFELEKKLEDWQVPLEILKKGGQYLHQGKQNLYNFIHENRKKYQIIKMCEVLEASTSTYYLWTKKPFSKRETRVSLLKKEIVSVFYEFKQHHGSILITRELHRRGYQISDTQVSFYMKQLGLRSKVKKKFKVTTDSKHNLYTSPNVLNRQF